MSPQVIVQSPALTPEVVADGAVVQVPLPFEMMTGTSCWAEATPLDATRPTPTLTIVMNFFMTDPPARGVVDDCSLVSKPHRYWLSAFYPFQRVDLGPRFPLWNGW
jgi:hypothetical protein